MKKENKKEMEKRKIEISAKLDRIKVWDFGMFPKHLADKTIKVDFELWHDFVGIRERYEMIYEELKKEYNSLVYTFNIDEIRTKRNPRDKREFKNDKQLVPNVWYSNDKTEMMIAEHPTIKPLEIIETIIKVSSNMGDTILDCFMGSGTTAVACIKTNRKFIGIEISPEYCKIANERIQKELSQTKLNSEGKFFSSQP